MRKNLPILLCLPVILTAVVTACAPGAAAPGTLPNISQIVSQVKPSVVAINSDRLAFSSLNQPVDESSAGSGWIIRSDGYIVTNNHVVDGATTVNVTLDDDRVFQATKVSADAVTDLAILKIDAKGLPALPVGDSEGVAVGQWVIVIGNALAEGISATQGIVSRKGISLSESPGQVLHDLIQTDAAINPGNSGGPMVDLSGKVIGINSLKISKVGVEGMGYAISIAAAIPVLDTLISQGCVVRAWLGVSVATLESPLIELYAVPVEAGVLITEVVAGGPGDRAGLKAGDVIVDVDGKAQSDDGAFTEFIHSLEIGQVIEVTYYRDGEKNVVSAKLVGNPCNPVTLS